MSAPTNSSPPNRRRFLQTSLEAATAAATIDLAGMAHAAGDDTIKIGFIGCGGRGTGACRDALLQNGVKLVAMGDLFADRIQASLGSLKGSDEVKDRIDVPKERQFVGFDAYQQVLAAGIDLVLLTTPPVFRPMQYAAAVAASKHIFMEKPLCVDAPGYRSLLETNRQAKEKKLCVAVGFQRHHQKNYLEGVKKVHEGTVGEMLLVRTYFNMPSGIEQSGKPAGMSEMEYQIRRWGAFCWACGDHIVEQACHEIDVANWILQGHPIRANGMGGRQVRNGRGDGDIWDHHFVEYEHANGVCHYCQARQQPNVWTHVSDNVLGTKGAMTVGSGPYGTGKDGYRTEKQLLSDFGGRNPYHQEHADLQASIRSGMQQFEADYGADSSMTAVLGRMATYSGQVVTWEDAVNSQLNFLPQVLALDAAPPAVPGTDGRYPIAMPGMTKGW